MKRWLLFLCLMLPSAAIAEHPQRDMVVAAQSKAAAAGIEMLEKGGNAFDAAAATALALGVLEPGFFRYRRWSVFFYSISPKINAM